jgi:putative oxidoreductase
LLKEDFMTEVPFERKAGGAVSSAPSDISGATTLQRLRRKVGPYFQPGGRIMNAIAARPSWGLVVLRLVAGGAFLDSGSRKLFQVGIFGVASLFGSMHLPLPLVSAALVTLVEVLGGIALLLGWFTRLTAALLAIDMLVAVLVVYFEPAFFKGGVELPLTLLAICVALALSGPGAASLDGAKARP